MKLKLAFDIKDRLVRYIRDDDSDKEYELNFTKYKPFAHFNTPNWESWIVGNKSYIELYMICEKFPNKKEVDDYVMENYPEVFL